MLTESTCRQKYKMYLNLISCHVTIHSLDWILFTGDKLFHQHAFPGFNPLCLSVCIYMWDSWPRWRPPPLLSCCSDRSGPRTLISRQWFNHNCNVLNVMFPAVKSIVGKKDELNLLRKFHQKKEGCTPPSAHFKSSSANKSPEGRCGQGAAGSRPADLAVSHNDLSAATPCVTHSLIKQPSILKIQLGVWVFLYFSVELAAPDEF